MRKFYCVGGSHDGETVNIKHGKRVLFASTNEEYRVYSEPLGNAMGVLVPKGVPEDNVVSLLEDKFPWFKAPHSPSSQTD